MPELLPSPDVFVGAAGPVARCLEAAPLELGGSGGMLPEPLGGVVLADWADR